MTYYIAA